MSDGAKTKWNRWKHTYFNFSRSIKGEDENKLQLFSNFASSNFYKYINGFESYVRAVAVAVLDSLYITGRNLIFYKQCLPSWIQQTSESVSKYLQMWKQMSKDCEFKSIPLKNIKRVG